MIRLYILGSIAVVCCFTPLAVRADAYDLYAAYGDSSWAVVDTATGEAWRVAGLAFAPRALTLDLDAGVVFAVSSYVDPWLATVDPASGQCTEIARITYPAGGEVYRCESLAYNPADDLLYCAVSLNGDDTTSETLATIDPGTATLTVLGPITGTIANDADAMTFIDGALFAIDDPGSGPSRFYSLAYGGAGAQATLIGILNNPRFNNVNDLAFDPVNRVLYGFDPSARVLITIDWTTGVGTLVGTTHAPDEFDGRNMYSLTMGPVRQVAVPDVASRALVARLGSAPNPFNPRTTVSFTLPTRGQVQIAIYDARGREVTRLVDETLAASAHTVDWDGRDAYGASMPSGTYFCRLTTSWGVETRKLQLVR